MRVTLAFAACLPIIVLAQPPAPLAAVELPAIVMVGASYNQYTGAAGFVSGIVPESQNWGIMASVTSDLVPTKYVNSSGKSGYLIAGSMRFGQHKVLLNTAKVGPAFAPSFMLTVGGDAGASFIPTPVSLGVGGPSTTTVGFSGSFTTGAFWRFKPHWALGVAVRALYMSGTGPNGGGAWNPVLEPGLVFVK